MIDGIENQILRLSPRDDAQYWLQNRALKLNEQVMKTRWLVLAGSGETIPLPFLIAVAFWLTVIFASFGLFASRNATPQGMLLIAFRNPIPDGKALHVPLENPQEVISGKAAKLGKPILLFLEGRGIRSIAYFDAWGSYLIIAGPYNDNGDFKLYRWSGAASANPEPVKGLDFRGLHPEALTIYPVKKTRIQILSDDVAKQVEGKDCKDKKVKTEKKSFRSVWVTV